MQLPLQSMNIHFPSLSHKPHHSIRLMSFLLIAVLTLLLQNVINVHMHHSVARILKKGEKGGKRGKKGEKGGKRGKKGEKGGGGGGK